MPVTADIDLLMRKVEDRSRKSANWLFVATFLIFAAVIIGVVGIYKQNAISLAIQKTQESQAAATVEARKLNLARQDNIINHVDCIILLSKKYPKVNFQALNYDQLKHILNDCAVKE